jgi:hypothetical protein
MSEILVMILVLVMAAVLLVLRMPIGVMFLFAGTVGHGAQSRLLRRLAAGSLTLVRVTS